MSEREPTGEPTGQPDGRLSGQPSDGSGGGPTALLRVAAAGIRCRIASVGDLPAIAEARWASRAEGGETPIESREAFVARFRRELEPGIRSGAWTYWVAETPDAQLVGQLAVRIVPGIPRPMRASDAWGYLTDAFVAPSHRDRGIGSALLAAASAWARARDLELLLAWPSDRARPWYVRAGFRDQGEVMTLALRAPEA